MKPLTCKLALAASLLVNAGVIAAAWMPHWRAPGAGTQALFGMPHEQVPGYLELDAAQRARWHAMETDFVRNLQAGNRQIEAHRTRLVQAVLGDAPDAAAIERERAAIFALQQAQQRAVIAQLLQEREMLTPPQRAALAELLLAQAAPDLTGR